MFTTQAFQQAKIFACHDEDDRAWLAHTVADEQLKRDEWFVRKGQPACFFVVLEGRLRSVPEWLIDRRRDRA